MLIWLGGCVNVGQAVVKVVGVWLMNVQSAIGVRPRSYICLEAACHLALIALGRSLK